MLLVKIGGSLITDKTRRESLRGDVLRQLAEDLAELRNEYPQQQIILGHGSGSFGHFEAHNYQTAKGVKTENDWYGFARVAHIAARLNRHVVDALLAAGVSAISVQPSASIESVNGKVSSLDTSGISRAMQHHLVPVFYGDVSYDTSLGGTIASTEAIMRYLVDHFPVSRIVLLGEVSGVLDQKGRVISHISLDNFASIAESLEGSRGVDVTGGMLSKVTEMLDIAREHPSLTIHIVDGRVPQVISRLLNNEHIGTTITANGG